MDEDAIQALQGSVDDLNETLKGLNEKQGSPYKRATNNYGQDTGGYGRGSGGIWGMASQMINSTTKAVAGGINKAYTSGLVQTGGYSSDEMFSISTALELAQKEGLSFKLLLGGIQELASQVTQQFYMESELRRKINEEAGLTGELSEDVRKEIFKSYPGVLNLGYGIEQLSEYYTDLIKQTGKFTQLNQESLVASAEVSRAFVGDLKDMGQVLSEFERIGIGATRAVEAIEDAGVETIGLGLRSKSVIEDVRKNIEMLNQYGFEDGVQGLAKMSRTATEFRMNLEDAFTVAEKVINPEGAVELSAQLQVIGGAVGEFADPLKLMYMATNNVEGLQEALIDAADGLATYNDEQGRFEVTGANLRRAKDMAEALGISMGDLSRTSIAAAERAKAASDLLSTGLQMSDEDREFLTNLGTMKDGQMTIQIPESLADKIGMQDTEVALSEMSYDLKEQLMKNRKEFEDMSARDLAEEQVTVLTKMERNIGSMAAMARIQAADMIRDSGPFKTMEGMMEGANQQLFDAWSGGRFKEFIEGGFSSDSAKGEQFKADLKTEFGSRTEELVKKMEALRQDAEAKGAIGPKQEKNNQQQQTPTQIQVTHSATNMVDALGRTVFTNEYLRQFTKQEREFTHEQHFGR